MTTKPPLVLVGSDSNLTRVIEFPNGGTDPTGQRVSDNFYDWRNRLVASKSGVQDSEDEDTQRPLVYFEYDNLGQVVVTEQYDGDGLFVVDADGDGVPDRPAADRLRARTVASYDDQGLDR